MSKYYKSTDPVSVVPLAEYDVEGARRALEALLSPIGGLDFVKEGDVVVIKANLLDNISEFVHLYSKQFL